MDAPPIQYCRTEGGVNIAYWTLGEGPAVLPVYTPNSSHIVLEWDVPGFRRAYELLARDFRVIRYNPRCSGLSDSGDDLSTEGLAQDISAVLSATGAENVCLMGIGNGNLITIPYAARHPEGLGCFVALSPMLNAAAFQKLTRDYGELLAEDHWRLSIHWFDPEGTDPAERLYALFRNALGDNQRRLMADRAGFLTDLSAELPNVALPTLVGHWPDHPAFTSGRDVAALVPGARLVVRKGSGFPWYDADPEGLIDLIRYFVLEHARAAVAPSAREARPTGVTLFARELEVVQLIAEGKSNAAIAEALVIAPGTVARHVSNVLAKTGLSNRTELARFASEQGLLGEG